MFRSQVGKQADCKLPLFLRSGIDKQKSPVSPMEFRKRFIFFFHLIDDLAKDIRVFG